MRGGPLDRRIALQRKGTAYSDSGEPIDAWSTLTERWSSMRPLQGIERNTAAQLVGLEQVQFVLRWSQDISDLSPLDRIVFPAADATTSPAMTRSIYDIFAVLELGRHESLQIMTARRAA